MYSYKCIILTTWGIMVILERRASRLRVSVGIPSYLTVPSVKMQRSRANVSVDFPEPVRPTRNFDEYSAML